MEKYFVTQITKTTDSNEYAILTTVKDTLKEAKMLYHQTLSSVYANDKIEHAIVRIDDFEGHFIHIETILPQPVEG